MPDVIKKGDAQQYEAEPHQGDPDTGVTPKVTLLWMTPDPLGAIASFNAMYSGRVVRDLNDITDEDRYQALADVQKTHLQAPLETIKMHFLIEGVDRAFTHQLVRQRTAVYAQESMRFAVLGDLIDATTLPPSLDGTERSKSPKEARHFSINDLVNSRQYSMASKEDRQRAIWDYVIEVIDVGYHTLVHGGMPSEEARGLLPHATATRIHFVTDMRNLKDHAGNRLCTQAQFHWRSVFTQMVQEVGDYGNKSGGLGYELSGGWQFEALAKSALWRPVCYQIGHCPFQASFDRACSIRDKVEKFARHGVSSEHWHDRDRFEEEAINPAEWMLRPDAARL